MATENLTPQTSASASSTTSEHVINPVIGKDNEPEVKTRKDQLAALKEEFELLQQKLKQFQETELENGGEKTSEDKETSVDSFKGTSTEAVDPSGPQEKGTGPTSRAKVLINRVDPTTGERKDEQSTDEVLDTAKESDTSHAFVLRKNIEFNSQDNYGEIEIVSRDLWKLLKTLLSHYPYHIFQGDPVTLTSPYEAIILNWGKLETAATTTLADEKDNQTRLDLKLLLDTISGGSGDPRLDKYLKGRDSNREQKVVSFESLWTIFPPGALVYGKPFQGQDQVFIVKDNLRAWPRDDYEPPPWKLQCWIYDWDGKTFKRRSLYLDFESFENSKPIISLPFYPLEYHPQPEQLKQTLINRGAKYKKLCNAKPGSRMFDYTGHVVFGKKGFSRMAGDDEDDAMTRSSYDRDSGRTVQDANLDPNEAASKSTNVDGRVMVDFESYFSYGPVNAMLGSYELSADSDECQCLECQRSVVWDTVYRNRFDKEPHQQEWEAEQYMLSPPRVLGYILHDKAWAQLQVTGLQDIPKQHLDHSWDRVKLADGEETKKMILNLVKGHGTADANDDESNLVVDDIVAKKGKGLVMLLYGPPGVGKTSTAETVAIAARKPLFSISVADVGTKAKNVEQNLSKIFALATSWQAILLIDEADVFLESRGRGVASSTERNALVSVFLRVLEYYQGILVLTTNQIAHFDVAVQSRIHIAIKYGKLSKEQTMAIFDGFLKPLAAKNCIKDIDDIKEWIEEDVSKIGLDGRQIRNIMTSALGMARAEGKTKLEKKDLKKIMNNVKDFKDDFLVQFEKYKNSQEGMIA